jgi:hypothetical protein
MKQVSEHHHGCAAGASSFREMADCGRRGAWPIVRSTALATTAAEFLWQTRNCRSSCREPEAWCRT